MNDWVVDSSVAVKWVLVESVPTRVTDRMARRGNAELRSIALWKLEGYSNEEIAGKLGCVERTIERRLQLIRQIWENQITP